MFDRICDNFNRIGLVDFALVLGAHIDNYIGYIRIDIFTKTHVWIFPL